MAGKHQVFVFEDKEKKGLYSETVFDDNEKETKTENEAEEENNIIEREEDYKIFVTPEKKRENLFLEENEENKENEARGRKRRDERQGLFDRLRDTFQRKSQEEQERAKAGNERGYIESDEPDVQTLYSGTFKDCVNWCEKEYFTGLSRDFRGTIGIGKTQDNLAIKYEFGDDGIIKTTYDGNGQPKLEETLTWDEVLSGQRHLKVFVNEDKQKEPDLKDSAAEKTVNEHEAASKEDVTENIATNESPDIVLEQGEVFVPENDVIEVVADDADLDQKLLGIVDELYDNDFSDEELANIFGGDTSAAQQQIAEEVAEMEQGVAIDEDKVVQAQKEAFPDYGDCRIAITRNIVSYDEGKKQSFEDCINELKSGFVDVAVSDGYRGDVEDSIDYVDSLMNGGYVDIIGPNGKSLASCSITEDNKLEVSFRNDDVRYYDLDTDIAQQIEDNRNQAEEPKEWSNNKEAYKGYEDKSQDEDER